MSHHHKLSLYAAIFININIMLGSGIFINTTILAKKAGLLGALSYACIGILMLPLIISITKLLKLYPAGGFYIFAAKEIHPLAGFISSWSYFIGKLASAVIIINIAMLLLQQIIMPLQNIPVLILDACIIFMFSILNLLDIRTNSTIQSSFLGLKLIPIFFGIFGSLYLISSQGVQSPSFHWESFPLTLPLVLFAIAGFEAACSLSSRIEDAEKNAPLAIFISYAFVIVTTTLFQLCLSGALGPLFALLPDYRFVFPSIITQLNMQPYFTALMHLAISASALGGAYGILFSNVWNIYALAQHNHLLGASFLTRFNRFHIPWLCIGVEGLICFIYLLVSRGNQIPLQQTGVLGPSIAYTMSALALIFAGKNKTIQINKPLAYLALFNCTLMIGVCVYGLILNGITSLAAFITLLAIGIVMYFVSAD